MAAAEPPTPPQKLLYIPLVIALCILTSVALTLIALHFLVIKLCSGDRRHNNPSAQGEKGGVDKKVLESIPVCAYTKRQGVFPLDQHECSVCLGELEEGDLVRVLPSCAHLYHVECIDAWFASNSSCPFCRLLISSCESLTLPIDVIEGSMCPLPQDHDGGGGGEGSTAHFQL